MDELRDERNPTGPTDEKDPPEIGGLEPGSPNGGGRELSSPINMRRDQPLEVRPSDMRVRERRRHGHVGVGVPGERLLGSPNVLVDDPPPTPIRQFPPLDERPPGLLIRPSDKPPDVLEQQLVDVRPTEVRIPPSSKRPIGPHDGDVDGPAPDIEHGNRPILPPPRKTGGIEDGSGHRFRHKHNPQGEPVPSLPKHPGTNGSPISRMGEHQLVDGPPTNPLPLGNGPGEHGPDNVPHPMHRGPKQQFGLINPPLGMRFKTCRVHGRLPISLLPHKEGPIITGINRRRHKRRTIDSDNLGFPPPHRNRDASTGRPKVDRHPQCHPHTPGNHRGPRPDVRRPSHPPRPP